MRDAVHLQMLREFQDGLTPAPKWEKQMATVPGLVEFVIDWIRVNRPLPDAGYVHGKPEPWQIAERQRERLPRPERQAKSADFFKKRKPKKQMELEI